MESPGWIGHHRWWRQQQHLAHTPPRSLLFSLPDPLRTKFCSVPSHQPTESDILRSFAHFFLLFELECQIRDYNNEDLRRSRTLNSWAEPEQLLKRIINVERIFVFFKQRKQNTRKAGHKENWLNWTGISRERAKITQKHRRTKQ